MRAAPFRLALCASALLLGCDSTPDPRQTNFIVKKDNVTARYDDKSGRLKRLEVDMNKNGVVDTWTFMDGTRMERIEIDRDENGQVDRWEHYAEGKLTSVGSSTRGDGVEDEWAYRAAAGYLERIETDTDRDGKIDKWSSYDPPRTPGAPPTLRSVATEPGPDGKPTFKMIYAADGRFERSETLGRR